MTRPASTQRMRRFAACRRGGVALVGVALIIPVVAAIGLSIDLTRLWLVQARLQIAVDASALVASRPINVGTADADAKALFWANFHREGTTATGYLGASAGEPVVRHLDADTVQVEATATLGRTLMGVLGDSVTTMQAQASAKRSTLGMELALVLDTTGSMHINNNISGLRTAAKDLVDIVFGRNETLPNLVVSVVPFVASVNIGKNREGWLRAGSLDQSQYGSAGWGGCVEARAGGEDVTDTPPREAPFEPFLWKSTHGRYTSTDGKPVKGDNDWTPTSNEHPDYIYPGPNLTCPQTKILPLTSSKSAVQKAIAGLRATNFNGGTMGNLGLQAGWFTLSPKWTGLWGRANSPLPYNTAYMQKTVVVMTDGDNQWYDNPENAPGQATSPYHDNVRNKDYAKDGSTEVEADYTGYGRLSENRLALPLPISNAGAKREIDKRTSQVCAKMKQEGIVIYTVVLGVNGSSNENAETQKLWRDCATKPSYYFRSPDKAALTAAFHEIGTRLANLRLTQ